MTEKYEDFENLLKTYFTAGVTPEFAENPKDADPLKGGLELYVSLRLRVQNRRTKWHFPPNFRTVAYPGFLKGPSF